MFKKSLLMLASVLLVSVIAFSAFTPAFASGGTEVEDIERVISELVVPLDEMKAIDRNWYWFTVFGYLIDCFPKVFVEGEYWPIETVVYPSDYAGAYLDESVNLHILLTKDVDGETKYDYRAILGYDEDVVFEVVEFPLFFLKDVQHTLNDVMREFKIQSTVVDEKTNRAEVGLYDRSTERDIIEFLKTKFDGFNAECIVFNDSAEMTFTASDTTTNVLAGSKITCSTGAWATAGFNAIKNGVPGVVFAGHTATTGDTVYNSKGYTIGQPDVSLVDGVDAAFAPFPVGMSQSWQMSDAYASFGTNKDCLTNYYATYHYFVGLSVKKIGIATGHTTGKIVETGKTLYRSDLDVHFYDLVHTTNPSLGGDSGGLTYVTFETLTTSKVYPNAIVGVTSFNSTYAGKPSTHVSSVWNIVNTLGCTPYLSPSKFCYGTYFTHSVYGPGSVTNPLGLGKPFPDGSYACIYGSSIGSGGNIVVATMGGLGKGSIYMYGSAGVPMRLYTYVSMSSTGPWTLVKDQFAYSVQDKWFDCGTYNGDFNYIAFAAVTESYTGVAINLDTVIVIP